MLRPASISRTCRSTSAGVPCRKSWLKTPAARPSGGIATPVRVHDRLRPPLTARVSDGNRVSVPICSATSWSSEIELRNELLAGCGAAVRKQMSEGWPPSTNGCDTPLSTVKSARCSSRSFRYGESV